MNVNLPKSVVLIVAHPDDETLWAGGAILSNPSWKWFVVCLCRGSDRDRAPKFYHALHAIGAQGVIGDLDDGPTQSPLDDHQVEQAIMHLLPSECFDLVITHSPRGEYTRHVRHEEIGKAVINLWHAGSLSTDALWNFAYEDEGRLHLPQAIKTAHVFNQLPRSIWHKKYTIITQIYGFDRDGWEAKTTPKAEAFWQFDNAEDAKKGWRCGAAII